MAKRVAERYEEDDYFAEPNYDLLTDEELDELYNFGALTSSAKRKKNVTRKVWSGNVHALNFDDDDWPEVDFDLDDDFIADN